MAFYGRGGEASRRKSATLNDSIIRLYTVLFIHLSHSMDISNRLFEGGGASISYLANPVRVLSQMSVRLRL